MSRPESSGSTASLVRRREKGRWLEMKVGSFFRNVAEVSKNRRHILDASFVAGALQQWEEFEEPVTREAERCGLTCREEVEFVALCAAGIWSLQEVAFAAARRRARRVSA
jgi:hypothetical protein